LYSPYDLEERVRRSLLAILFVSTALAGVPASAQENAPDAGAAQVAPPPSPGNLPEARMVLATLDALHKNGALGDAEYRAALDDLAELGNRAKEENTLLVGRFATTMYGFVEGDVIRDDTRSFLDGAGSGAIARPDTLSGQLGRTLFGVRNSRIGFRVGAPEYAGMRASAILEMDFLGNQPANPPRSSGYSEAPFFNNPTFRVRHMLLKLDSDVVNLWIGQTWELVGWQGGFQPNTVAIQGIPGELYARTAQVRLDRTIKAGPLALELAVAVLRPPQMDSGVPDLQAGIKLAFTHFTAVQTIGQTGTAIAPAALGISGGIRHFRLPNFATAVTGTSGAEGKMLAADLLLPVIPAAERKAWALTVLAEGALSSGYADQYSGLSGGAGVGQPSGVNPADYAKVADVDPGLVGWSSQTGQLTTADWRTLIVSAQLYLPPQGKLWVAGSYSNSYSDDSGELGAAKSVFGHEIWWDANLFADLTPAVRLGFEYSQFRQTYGDGIQATNNRLQFSGFFIF
jgi:hypothetical protein